MDHYLTVGGKRRQLKITMDDAEEVEGMFPRPDGSPASLYDLCVVHLGVSGSFRVQCALLWACLRHDKKTTLQNVKAWFAEHRQNGGKLDEILNPVARCINASGVLGFVVPLEPEDEEPDGPKAAPEAIKAAE